MPKLVVSADKFLIKKLIIINVSALKWPKVSAEMFVIISFFIKNLSALTTSLGVISFVSCLFYFMNIRAQLKILL